MTRARLSIFVASLLVSVLFGQEVHAEHTIIPDLPKDGIPTWVFTWTMTAVTIIGGVLLAIIRILWSESRKVSGLSDKERIWLRELHSTRTDLPPAWRDKFDIVDDQLKEINTLLQELVRLNNEERSHLIEKIEKQSEIAEKQTTKIMKLALRVQRAIEALAGLAPPEVERDIE